MDPIIQLVFWSGILLAFKHFLADGLFQTNYQYTNKGKWGHPGGLIHAGNHGGLTFVAVILSFLFSGVDKPLWYVASFAGIFAVGDAILHYLIDLAKVRIGQKFGWSDMGQTDANVNGENKKAWLIYDKKFFWAIIADQSLHFITYILIIVLMMNIVLNTPHIAI